MRVDNGYYGFGEIWTYIIISGESDLEDAGSLTSSLESA